MKEHGLSMDETFEELYGVFENAWKNINEVCTRPTPVSLEVLLRAFNIARFAEVGYNTTDGFTDPGHFEDDIYQLYIRQMPI